MGLTLKSGWWFSLLLLVSLVSCGKQATDLPKGFTEFRDSDGRFTMLYPDNWTFLPDPQANVRLSDPADPNYQVTITVGKINPKIKSLAQFDQVAFGKKLTEQLAPNSNDPDLPKTIVEQRKTFKRTDKLGRLYYGYEVVIATNGRARHAVFVAVVDKGSFYTLLTGCGDDTWASRQEKITRIAMSFQILPATPA